MNPKYRYKVLRHQDRPPLEFDWEFQSQVGKGWRLVTIVKQPEGYFYSYWEKPYED